MKEKENSSNILLHKVCNSELDESEKGVGVFVFIFLISRFVPSLIHMRNGAYVDRNDCYF